MPSDVRDVNVENLLAGRRFLVEWNLNLTAEGVTSYLVHRSEQSTQGYQLITTIASPTNQFIDKVPYTFGIQYFYKVIARNASGVSSDINTAAFVSDMTFDSFEEKPFRSVTVTFDSLVKGEALTGTKDSANLIFTTVSLYRFNSVEVFRNGLALERNVGFAEDNDQTTITLTVAPDSGDSLITSYSKV